MNNKLAFTVEYQGQQFGNATKDHLMAAGIPVDVIETAELEHCRQQKLDEINKCFDKDCAVLNQSYSASHLMAFPVIDAEIRAYQIDANVNTPLLDAALTKLTINKANYVAEQAENANDFYQVVGAAMAKHHNATAALAIATTVEQISQINWE